tara:strand:+ start:114 stop:566 length:453 start_codon:yes stop_codon:yes gene_type:complete
MQNLKILNSKEKKEILNILKKQFGFKEKLDYTLLKNEKGKLYCINNEFSSLDLSKLRINTIGLYFARQIDNNIRLTIEGSQMIGKNASKNIVEITKDEMLDWLKGNDLNKEVISKEFIILKHKNDFLGCGKCSEGKIFNYVPKARRINLN